MDKYDVCAPTRDDSELYGMPCYGGMDLSTTQDLTSFCLAWKHPDGGYDMRWWFWIPGDKLMDRIKKDGVPYQVWANDGWLELIPGEVIDQEYVKQRIMEICAQYRVVTIGADKFNNTWIMQELDRNKINVQPFAQNAGTITEPAKELMTRVIEGKFRHGCNPVARWNFSNAVIKKFPNDTFRLDKDKAEKRIDGVAAAIMAVGCSMQDIKVESVYARYGVLSGSG
jgi:phage terminase large subunit-like protein